MHCYLNVCPLRSSVFYLLKRRGANKQWTESSKQRRKKSDLLGVFNLYLVVTFMFMVPCIADLY